MSILIILLCFFSFSPPSLSNWYTIIFPIYTLCFFSCAPLLCLDVLQFLNGIFDFVRTSDCLMSFTTDRERMNQVGDYFIHLFFNFIDRLLRPFSSHFSQGRLVKGTLLFMVENQSIFFAIKTTPKCERLESPVSQSGIDVLNQFFVDKLRFFLKLRLGSP